MVPLRPYDPAAVERARASIDSLYQKKGYYLATVSVRKVDQPDGTVRTVFEINEGRRVAVSRIIVNGNQRFSADEITAHMKTGAEGFFWFQKGEYKEDNLERDVREQLPDFYAQRGYVDFRVVRDTLIVAEGTGKATLVLDVDADRDLGVGYRGRASLTIGSGVAVSTRYGLLGYNAGSTGTARVTGRDSTWTCYGLGLGVWGTGSLLIDGGATVSNVSTELASYDSSIGAVTITGNGSRLMNTNELYDGISGTGTLTIADGGQATAVKAIIGSNSSMRLYVTGDDMLVVGSALTPGSITSDGTIDLFSDTRLGPGVYQPISEYAGRPITWSGTGSINAYGGTWDNLAGTFTVSAPIELTAGTAQTISAGERMIITDADSGGWISASFGAGSEDASFAGAPIAQSNQSALALLSGDSVLSAWSFTTDLTDARVLLSFDIGQGISNLKVWHFDGANWTPYAPADLYYDSVNGVASFTVDSFSGYAITPEPSALSLIAAAGLLVLRCRRAHAAPTNSAFQPKVGCP
jgi:T5SS/PEP-CTERM-associated repeat protein